MTALRAHSRLLRHGMTPEPVHVIGAGIGGLVLGRCLQRRGIPTILYDHSTEPLKPRYNYGITLYAQAYLPLLHYLDLDESEFRERVALKSGLASEAGVSSKDTLRTDRGSLEQLLGYGLDIRWRHHVREVKCSAGSLSVHFQDQPSLNARLVIDASGVHSCARQGLSINPQTHVLPWVVYRGTRRLSDKATQLLCSQSIRDNSIVETKIGQTLLQLSFNGKRDDSDSVLNYIYSRPARREEDLLYRPDRAADAATDVPQAFYHEIAGLEDLASPFKQIFEADAMRGDRILHWLMRRSLPRKDRLKEASRSGMVCIGDSVHAMPILGGKGANSVIEDAVILTEYIALHKLSGSQDGAFDGFYDSVYDRWLQDVMDSEARLEAMHAEATR